MKQMKKLILVLMLFGIIMSCAFAQKDSPSEFVIGKGTNLAHWLSQSRQRGEERRLFIQEKDIEYIDDLGNRHNDAFEIMTGCIGKEFNKQVLVDMMGKPFKKAKELNLPLYCGEYGVLKGYPKKIVCTGIPT